MTVTPEDCVVHWPGSSSIRTQTNSYYSELPYQSGKELEYSPTEIISSEEEEPGASRRTQERRTIYMADITELPLIAPEIPDIRSSDESEGNISLDEKTDENEDEDQRQARLKRNKRKLGRKNRAHQRKQAWEKYRVELIEYNKKKARKEAERNSKQDRIKELTKELESLKELNRDKEPASKEPEDREKEPGTREKEPGATVPQDKEPQRRSAFQRLGEQQEESSNKRQETQTRARTFANARSQSIFTRPESTRRFDDEEEGESDYR